MSQVDESTLGPAAEVELPSVEADPRVGLDEGTADRIWRLEKQTLTVTVEGPLLRVVAFRGRRAAAWATLDLDDPDAAALPPGLAEFAGAQTRQLIDLPFYASLVRYLEKPTAKARRVRARQRPPMVAAGPLPSRGNTVPRRSPVILSEHLLPGAPGETPRRARPEQSRRAWHDRPHQRRRLDGPA